MSLLAHATRSLVENTSSYAYGYEAGHKAGGNIAVGKPFLGAMGYADRLAGSSPACRQDPCWRGAMNGYFDGLPPEARLHGVTVDARGIITKIG
jgi:hypothetical protein